jgi:aryl-alcohol dehydrogenase-like predicted oxidoreductase
MSLTTYYTLGRTGLRVSRLCLGAMTFSSVGYGIGEDNSRAIFDRYVDAGGNFIDTADGYGGGESERLVGKFINGAGLRNRMVIATKFSFCAEPGNPNAGGNNRKNILRALEGSLQRLGTDYIDLYILHNWDQLTPAEEVIRTLDEVVRSGKARYIGISNTPAWYAARLQTLALERNLEPVSSMQLEYSLLQRDIEREHLPLAQELGMGVTAWSPLSGGLLTGKYFQDGGRGDDIAGRLNKIPSSMPLYQRTERARAIEGELRAVAGELGEPMTRVAINWVANRPGVASVLVGASNPNQFEESVTALDFTLPAELSARLTAASQPDTLYPYYMQAPAFNGVIHGGTRLASKPEGYHRETRIGFDD